MLIQKIFNSIWFVSILFLGDIMAPTMNNLEKLVKQPYGCGEQNMISMVPNVSLYAQSQIIRIRYSKL